MKKFGFKIVNCANNMELGVYDGEEAIEAASDIEAHEIAVNLFTRETGWNRLHFTVRFI